MRLASVSLIVPDYDSAIAFYCGQMGFDLVADEDQGRKRWVEVRPPGGGPSFVLARADGATQ
ncbi:MAG: VOC family protein, partial [Pseudomonadota bacterium]